MKFAMVDDQRCEAIPNIKGFCPCCGAEVIPKCGETRIWHWAHKKKSDCAKWHEPETPWHRYWKNRFPKECQEFIIVDEITNEKHIADVKLPWGLVLEFQHSHIAPPEQYAREFFYKKMLWVVDGTRCKRDIARLMNGCQDLRNTVCDTDSCSLSLCDFPDEIFSKNWINRYVSVFFDFRGCDQELSADVKRNVLYGLLKYDGHYWVFQIPHDLFVSLVTNNQINEKIISLFRKYPQRFSCSAQGAYIRVPSCRRQNTFSSRTSARFANSKAGKGWRF